MRLESLQPLFVLLFLIKVTSQMFILDKVRIKQGHDFTVTCDADRALIPKKINSIAMVAIEKASFLYPKSFIMLAQYTTYGSQREVKNIPPDRKWNVKFSGSGTGTNNRRMKITVGITESECQDAGVYVCHVGAAGFKDKEDILNRTEEVVFYEDLTNEYFKADPDNSDSKYQQNTVLKLTCAVDGPQKNASLFWRVGRLQDPTISGERLFSDYNISKDVQNVRPTPIPYTCQFRYKSILKMTINKSDHNNVTYMCLLQQFDQEIIIDQMIIHVSDGWERRGAKASQTSRLACSALVQCFSFALTMLYVYLA